MHNIVVLAAFCIFGYRISATAIKLRKIRIDFKGRPPLKKQLYHIGKIAVLINFFALLFRAIKLLNNIPITITMFEVPEWLSWIAVFILCIGILIIFISYVNLGVNVKLGLPKEKDKTYLETNGIYKYSRNPIYIGFYLMCIASSLYVLNPINWFATIVGIIIHHKQVLSEEIYLEKSFGDEWFNYKNKVKRYI